MYIQITDAVHANGSYIYLQLWALGRAASYAQLQKEDPSLPYVSASDILLNDPSKGRLRPVDDASEDWKEGRAECGGKGE